MASSFLASTLTRAAARRLAAASTALPRQHARTTVRTLSSALLHSNARLARTTLFPAMTRPRPAMWVPSAGMKIKTSDKASPEAEGAAAAGEPANKKESPKRPEQDAEKDGDQGLDLFAQAAKNQKRRDAEAATAAGGGGGAAGTAAPPPGEGEAAKLEDPVEAERQRKWKQAAEEEERKQMAKSGRNVAITLGLIGLGCFIYLGLPDNEEQQPKEGESYFARYHIRAWDNLKNLRKVP
ncbi:hypothetical protein DFJ77DRAFT_324752 [Powellomyces hirtus]|nr:hypothetical protein DFJ77DRAFT_324752 [Powellomyces hirtus]